MKHILPFVLFLAAAFVLPLSLQAQSKPINNTPTTPKTAKSALPYCDAVLKTEKVALQKEANSACASKMVCMPCMERTTKTAIHACLVAHPTTPACAAVGAEPVEVERAAPSGTANRNQTPANNTAVAQAFDFEIMRSVCDRSGVSLEVFIPGNTCGDTRETYTYLWELDGGKGGHESKVECTCAKEVKVIVTKSSTGERVTKMIRLQPTCESNDRPVKN
ncbi:MAG: hypothetical protein IPL65_05010 [Lewinellaceae bacterium]|nr:hypothetical protein [Lewinellaceae bacterium]